MSPPPPDRTGGGVTGGPSTGSDNKSSLVVKQKLAGGVELVVKIKLVKIAAGHAGACSEQTNSSETSTGACDVPCRQPSLQLRCFGRGRRHSSLQFADATQHAPRAVRPISGGGGFGGVWIASNCVVVGSAIHHHLHSPVHVSAAAEIRLAVPDAHRHRRLVDVAGWLIRSVIRSGGTIESLSHMPHQNFAR